MDGYGTRDRLGCRNWDRGSAWVFGNVTFDRNASLEHADASQTRRRLPWSRGRLPGHPPSAHPRRGRSHPSCVIHGACRTVLTVRRPLDAYSAYRAFRWDFHLRARRSRPRPWFDNHKRLRELITELENLSLEVAENDPAGTANRNVGPDTGTGTEPSGKCGQSPLNLWAGTPARRVSSGHPQT
jgi:hypothetical protein